MLEVIVEPHGYSKYISLLFITRSPSGKRRATRRRLLCGCMVITGGSWVHAQGMGAFTCRCWAAVQLLPGEYFNSPMDRVQPRSSMARNSLESPCCMGGRSSRPVHSLSSSSGGIYLQLHARLDALCASRQPPVLLRQCLGLHGEVQNGRTSKTKIKHKHIMYNFCSMLYLEFASCDLVANNYKQ